MLGYARGEHLLPQPDHASPMRHVGILLGLLAVATSAPTQSVPASANRAYTAAEIVEMLHEAYQKGRERGRLEAVDAEAMDRCKMGLASARGEVMELEDRLARLTDRHGR